jgi:hypothetical protein
MSSIKDAFGSNYKIAACNSKIQYITKIIANNVAHLNFGFKLDDTSIIWEQNNMKPDYISKIVIDIMSINQKFRVHHIQKDSPAINMFPYFLKGPVEYFRILDISNGKIYLFYITPNCVKPM